MALENSSNSAEVFLRHPLVPSNFLERVEEVIKQALPNLQHLHRPALQIQGIFCDTQDLNHPERPQDSALIGTVDLLTWCSGRNIITTNSDTHAGKTETHQTSEISRPPAACATGERGLRRGAGNVEPQIPQIAFEPRSLNSHGRSKRRRKVVGEIYPPVHNTTNPTPPASPSQQTKRQLRSSSDIVPQRKKPSCGNEPCLRPSTVDKLIIGIWEQIYSGVGVVLPSALPNLVDIVPQSYTLSIDGTLISDDFCAISKTCYRVSCVGRSFRALEVVVQARWIDFFNVRVATLDAENPGTGPNSNSKAALMEACQGFGWSEKELRNRMAVWRGYHEIKEAAGWAALVFAGAGIYRYCKYRIGFDNTSIAKLSRFRSRFEVAADTLQPQWRELLSVVPAQARRVYHGHPHDWVVGKSSDPVPLAWTYRQWDSNFTYEHITESVLDQEAWGEVDPRRVLISSKHICFVCQQLQSEHPNENRCQCFPDLYGSVNARPPPVQVFQAKDGRNNGLLACCSFDRGNIIGEFVGLVTKDLKDVDVMCGQAGEHPGYQIWQGRQGNHTRFINHSCLPNCQFQKFLWMGTERIVVVSKGVAADSEITVDYSGTYWKNLAKECLCGQTCCRYTRDRP